MKTTKEFVTLGVTESRSTFNQGSIGYGYGDTDRTSNPYKANGIGIGYSSAYGDGNINGSQWLQRF